MGQVTRKYEITAILPAASILCVLLPVRKKKNERFDTGVQVWCFAPGCQFLFLAFWLLGILVEEPDSMWAIGLSMHAFVFLCFAVGLWLMGRRLTLTGWQKIAWWIGAIVLVAGTVAGWLVFVAGILVLAVFEMTLRNRIAGATLVAGSIPLALVYLRGVHYGDEDSRSATSVEELLAVVGVVLVAVGFAAIGANQLKRHERSVSSS